MTAALVAIGVAGFGAFVAAIANHYLEQCDVDALEEYIESCFEDDIA